MLRKRAFQEGQFSARAPWLDGRSWGGEEEDETAAALSGEEAGEGLFEEEDEGVVYVGEDELEDAPLVPGTRILDFTSRSPKEHRRGDRDPAKVFALVLHQMACCYKRKSPDRYLAIKSHFAILHDGTILQLHPTRAMIWTSNGLSKGSVAVEFAGNFPNTRGKWWSGKKMGENRVQPAQIEAGRYLVEHLIRTMGLRTILAHRQSSDTRENDPGPDIWYHVGQWAVEKRGLSDGGTGFKVGSGKAIPDEWRTWDASGAHPLQEAEGGDEREGESPSERTDKAYVRWVQEALNKILGASLTTDGKIGPRTRSAVRSFQEQTSWMGLSATGTVDKLTELALWMRGSGTVPALGAPASPAAAPSPAPASPGGAAVPAFFPTESAGNLRLVPFENPGGGRIQDKTPPPASALVTIDRVGGGTRPLRREAADAWRALVAAARADGLAHPLLLVTSGFRDPVQQQALWDKALARYGSAQAARKWVAPPGSSPHQSGRAIDFYLGGKNDSANVGNLRKLPAYQWMIANAVRFGFYPYQNEPLALGVQPPRWRLTARRRDGGGARPREPRLRSMDPEGPEPVPRSGLDRGRQGRHENQERHPLLPGESLVLLHHAVRRHRRPHRGGADRPRRAGATPRDVAEPGSRRGSGNTEPGPRERRRPGLGQRASLRRHASGHSRGARTDRRRPRLG
jgi:peptidoglycan hydrolase-like protein with peptidoglycan-binding domain